MVFSRRALEYETSQRRPRVVARGRADLDRHLVGRATDTAAADLKGRLDVVHGALERDDRVGAGLLAAALEGAVDDALGELALAGQQDLVDQLGDQRRVVNRVREQRTARGRAFTRHVALLLLRAVTATCLLTVADTLGVQRTANDLVANAGQVLHTTAADEHDRVLLQVVADTRDVGGHLNLAAQLDASDLAQCRVRLLGRGRVHTRAHAAPLGAPLQRRRLGLACLRLAALADQLLDCGHRVSPLPFLSSATSPPRNFVLAEAAYAARTAAISAVAGVTRLRRPPRSGVSSGARARRLDFSSSRKSVIYRGATDQVTTHVSRTLRRRARTRSPGMPGHEGKEYLT